jgi:hypothetical protein
LLTLCDVAYTRRQTVCDINTVLRFEWEIGICKPELLGLRGHNKLLTHSATDLVAYDATKDICAIIKIFF